MLGVGGVADPPALAAYLSPGGQPNPRDVTIVRGRSPGELLLSGLLCGLAGVALVTELGSFDFTTGSVFLVPVIAAAVLGGVGQPYGAMLGALVIGLATELDATYFSPTYKDVVAFVVLIVVLLIRPQGIFAEVASQKEVAA